jgi:hypothetical protein
MSVPTTSSERLWVRAPNLALTVPANLGKR